MPPRSDMPSSRVMRPRPPKWSGWAVVALLVLGGCATGRPPPGSLLVGLGARSLARGDTALDTGGGGPAPMPLPLVQGGAVMLDDFETLLRQAGLGELLEAKGLGYANKFTDTLLDPKRWFTRGARNLVEQAQRQLRAAKGTPIRWHVAEAKTADAIRKLFAGNGVEGIEVVHTLALP